MYEEDLRRLIQQAREGDIGQAQFADRLKELATAIALLAFLRGSHKTEDQLSREEQRIINEQIRIAIAAAERLTEDIYAGVYDETPDGEPPARSEAALDARILMWATSALLLYSVGQTYQEEDVYLTWNLGGTIEHCADCAGLAGQRHRASTWQRMGIHPQSPALECTGILCQCTFTED